MKYSSYFFNFFFAIGRRLGRNDFAKFVKYLLDALKADTSGKYTDLVAVLEPKYLAFVATLVARNSGTGEAMTLTYGEVVKECLTFVKVTMRKKVLPEFDKTSAGYKAFLPNGLTEYSEANQATFPLIFDRFVKACASNEAVVSLAVKTEGEALLSKLNAKGTEKNTTDKTKQDHIASLDADEADIAVVMFGIYGRLIEHFAAKPNKAYDFFDFNVINDSQAADAKEEADMPEPVKPA